MSQAIPLLSITVKATGTVTQKRFVNAAGTHATAATRAVGVTRFDGVSTDALTVDSKGAVEIEAGGAIAQDAEFEVGANGKAVTLASGKSMGVALEAASGDTVVFQGLLI